MTSPAALGLVGQPPPEASERKPAPRSPANSAFEALLGDDTSESPLHAEAFERLGILGRRNSATPESPHAHSSADQTLGEKDDVARDDAYRTPAALPSMAMEATAGGAPEIASKSATPVAALETASAEEPAVSLPTLVEPNAPQLLQEESSDVDLPVFATRTPAPPLIGANTNAVMVAIHAVEQGCVVYARAGRMSATERESLQHSIRALLAEHGFSTDAIVIDEVRSERGAGGDQWPR